MEKLKFRIELLKNSDLIDEQIYNKIISLVSHLDKQWDITSVNGTEKNKRKSKCEKY